jgi:hypothetical protein
VVPVLTPSQFIRAAHVSDRFPAPQEFGSWAVRRRTSAEGKTPESRAMFRALYGFEYVTFLYHATEATQHLVPEAWSCVMEDSVIELSRHLPIWMAARGRVLVTGLGLGCVVRGLLINPEVEHVDVIELDPHIIREVGSEFDFDRVTIHRGDALTLELEGSWDYAWHDLWCDGPGLHGLHVQLLARFHDRVRARQGAWMFPRTLSRAWPGLTRAPALLGSPKQPRTRRAAAPMPKASAGASA